MGTNYYARINTCKCCGRAGLLKQKPGLHFHCLRSGFISHALKKGIPIHQIRDLVGHENIATTNIYSITSIDESIKSYEELF